MEIDDEFLFFFRELPSLDIRPKVVGPPKPAALSAPVKAGELWEQPPTPMMTMLLNEFCQLLVLLRCPRTLL